MRIRGMKDTKLYMINDIMFAAIFIIARVFLTPLFMVYMYEGENILYSIPACNIGIAPYVSVLKKYN
jgi:hypothetical protein